MKHRKNKIKRQHSMIEGLERYLEDRISPLDFVDGIIPGEINVGRGTGQNLVVEYKYPTVSGVKLIAKSGSSIQEVFVITNSPERLRRAVQS